eukprot:SAG25_NODE_1235_length_3530_cov_88.379773_3_plen_61_part_00
MYLHTNQVSGPMTTRTHCRKCSEPAKPNYHNEFAADFSDRHVTAEILVEPAAKRARIDSV